MNESPYPHPGAHYGTAKKLSEALEHDGNAKALLEHSLCLAAEVNPDLSTNPVRTVDDYLDFLDWACVCLPCSLLKSAEREYPLLYEQIDQSLCYFYFLLDIPLPELEGKGLYHPCLEYIEPFSSMASDYNKAWGEFLKTSASWNEEFLQKAFADKRFGLDKGWYEGSENWRCFNDFFSRHLSSPDARPIADKDDMLRVSAPADSTPQGVWRIENGVIDGGARIKSKRFTSIADLLSPKGARYADMFDGGVMTHTYLDEADYHRYHFPVSGTVEAMYDVPALCAVGGFITGYDAKSRKYLFSGDDCSWQSLETRSCVILRGEPYGVAAVMPVGMSQICSCNFEKELHVGSTVKKGDPMGYFLFGGSDIIMLFGKSASFSLEAETGKHLLMGSAYGSFKK